MRVSLDADYAEGRIGKDAYEQSLSALIAARREQFEHSANLSKLASKFTDRRDERCCRRNRRQRPLSRWYL